MTSSEHGSQPRRLEELWSGDFGDAYTERNEEAGAGRETFWRQLLAGIEVTTALEVGCNVGANLRWIAEILAPRDVFGVDVNEGALAGVRRALSGVNAVYAPPASCRSAIGSSTSPSPPACSSTSPGCDLPRRDGRARTLLATVRALR